MLYADLVDVPIDVFGGYCPAIPPSDLPPGAAAVAQDVSFPQGAVRTRGGLQRQYTLPNGAAVNGLKTYSTPTLAERLMVWDSLGNLYKESPQGTLTLLFARPYSNLFYQSQTLFGREYQAFFNALGGFDIPRQYDDTNWDRVSQVGPGSGPAVANYLPPPVATGVTGSAAANISSVIWGGLHTIIIKGFNLSYYTFYTINTAAPHGFSVGDVVLIAGANANPSINGSATIASVPGASSFTVTFFAEFPVVNGTAAGTATPSTSANSLVRSKGSVLVTTAAPHHFQVGWTVQISGYAAIAIGGGISAISQSAGIGTCTTATAHGLVPGAFTVVTGTTNFNSTPQGWQVLSCPSPTSFTFVFLQNFASEAAGAVATPLNGTFVIASIPSASTFTYVNVGPDKTSATAGTATIVGNIVGGLHQVSVSFITRQGFITQPSPPVTFYAAGNQMAGLSNLAIGPANVVARLISVTPVILPPATTGSFYSMTSSTMLVPDNTTTAAVIDFLDTILIASFQANYLFTQLELGESAFSIGYNSRTFWTGERAKVSNFVNLTFDGGFDTDINGNQFPRGWTEVGAAFAGGGQASVLGLPADYGDAYAITGSGAVVVGEISQSAYQDALSVPIIAANTSYSVRARIRLANGLAQGTLRIRLASPSTGLTTIGLAVPSANLTSKYQEFTATLTNAPLARVPADLVLLVFADGTPTNGGTFLVDSIEPFATATPFNYSTARASHAFNPESFDGTTGQIQVKPSDGQQLHAGFPLRNNLYLAKDHYLCYVTDDGVNEPANWAVNEVSGSIGICGSNAVDWTEEWAVFAERAGLHLCWGSDPVKVTPEIQNDASLTGKICWNSINQAASWTMWVRIDKVNKMILVGAPVNGATTPNVVFMLDYRWLEGAQDIASSPLVTYSQFTGKVLAHGRGRRWALWNIQANSMCFAERTDGTAQPFFGNGITNGKIYQQIEPLLQNGAAGQTSDDGVAINSIYSGYAAPSSTEEQMYRLGAHRKLLGYLKLRAIGSGTLRRSISTGQRTTLLRSYTLSLSPPADIGVGVNMHSERFLPTVQTNAVGDWFQLEKWILCMKKDATIPVRGTAQ